MCVCVFFVFFFVLFFCSTSQDTRITGKREEESQPAIKREGRESRQPAGENGGEGGGGGEERQTDREKIKILYFRG